MKKILFLTLALILSISTFGRHWNKPTVEDMIVRETLDSLQNTGDIILHEIHVVAYQDTTKKSDYEKYWEEKNGPLNGKDSIKSQYVENDDLYYKPSLDKHNSYKNELSQVEQKSSQQTIVNNYYVEPYYPSYSTFFSPFSFSFSFNYGWGFGWGFYDPWYWGYPYYGYMYHPYYGYPYYPYYYYPYCDYYPYYGGGSQYNTYGTRSSRTVTSRSYLGTQHIKSMQPTYNTSTQARRLNNPSVSSQNTQTKTNTSTQTQTQRREAYTPTYNKPSMSSRPSYNRTNTNHTYNNQSTPTYRSTGQTQTRSTTPTHSYSAPSRSSSYSVPSRSNSQSYSAPSRSSSQSYSAPSRSNSSQSYSSPSGSSSHGSSGNSGNSSGGRRK
jgi:hypothetical protein